MSEKKVFKSMDGNEAASYISYAFTETAAIYPITPSSPMATHVNECYLQTAEEYSPHAQLIAKKQVEHVFQYREPATNGCATNHAIDEKHHLLATGQHQ